MTPGQQLQRLLAEIPTYEAQDLMLLLPLSAALQSAIYARILILHSQASFPDIDYLLDIDDVAPHLGKSTRWIRDNLESLPFGFKLGSEYRFSLRRLEKWIDDNTTG